MFRHCIDNIYQFAHQVYVVQGATKAVTHYWDGDTSYFTKDGHSTDGTLQYLYKLKQQYPKLNVITGQGFWNGKTQMCNEYAKRASGDYVWQLDSDQFYKKQDMKRIIKLLEQQSPDAMHFYANHFWGGYDYCMDQRQWDKWGNGLPWKRVFKNVPGRSSWISHEPPEYKYDDVICNKGKVIDRDTTLKMGIKMYHYSYVQQSQVQFKSKFYRNRDYISMWQSFKSNKQMKIFDRDTHKFWGQHPQIIRKNYL